MGGIYVLMFFRDGDDLFGVNVLDMVCLNDYLQGRMLLSLFFQLIVVDLNSFGMVDSEDLMILLKIMLGIIFFLEEFLSWCFVDVFYVFLNVENLWEEGLFESI